MASRARPFSSYEKQLFEALQPLARGDGELPDIAEVEPGALLWLTREAWRQGAHRDGRSGHLSDTEVANLVEKQARAGFDRNRYQAMFGKGKKLPTGDRYFQPVPLEVARAFLDVALKHWDAPEPRDPKNPLAGFMPFAQFSEDQIDRAVTRATEKMYAAGKTVICRKPLGPGPRGLCRDLGAGGYSVVVMGRDESIRMDDPDRQIEELACLLNLILDQGRGPKEESLHVWAIQEPQVEGSRKASRELVRKFRSISSLRAILEVVDELNSLELEDWPRVDLERCVVAVRDASLPACKIFADAPPAVWQMQGVDPNPEASIPNFAVNPEGSARFFIFPANRNASTAPFIEVTDPDNGLRDELMEVLTGAREMGRRRVEGWTFHKARDFVRRGIREKKEANQ